jgi:hypothetical protein
MLLRAPQSFVAASAGATGSPSNAENATDQNSGPRDGHDALPSAEFAAWTRTSTSDDGTEEAASFGVRMLARMGFRQRLGRHETGIINPISLASHSSSAGLGFSDVKRKVCRGYTHIHRSVYIVHSISHVPLLYFHCIHSQAPSVGTADSHDSASNIASAPSKQQRVAPPPLLTIHRVLPSRSLPALAIESSMPTQSSAAQGERGLGSNALPFAHLLVHASAVLPTSASQLLRTSWATVLHSLILHDDAPVVIPAFPVSTLSAPCPFGAALVRIDTDAESDSAVLVAILHAWAAVLTEHATDATMLPRCERAIERIRLLLDDEAAQYDVIERVEADYCARAKGAAIAFQHPCRVLQELSTSSPMSSLMRTNHTVRRQDVCVLMPRGLIFCGDSAHPLAGACRCCTLDRARGAILTQTNLGTFFNSLTRACQNIIQSRVELTV